MLANKLSGLEYPKAVINAGWKTILLNQFHDIIPGSSIEEVYIESDRQYAEIKKVGDTAVATAFDKIASGVDKTAGKIVYTPNGFATDRYALIDGKTAFVENVLHLAGKPYPSLFTTAWL